MKFSAISLLLFGFTLSVASVVPECPIIECPHELEAGCFISDDACQCSCALDDGSCHHVISNSQRKCKFNELLECSKESSTCKCQCEHNWYRLHQHQRIGAMTTKLMTIAVLMVTFIALTYSVDPDCPKLKCLAGNKVACFIGDERCHCGCVTDDDPCESLRNHPCPRGSFTRLYQ
ncbi:hypothetical protein MTO96_044962 [Rhipicephalus appendiculatus]